MSCSFSVTTSNDSFISPSSYCLVKHVPYSTFHIPLAISKCISLFLTLPGSFLETKVTGKRINGGGGSGLEVTCKYRTSGQEKAVDWIKRKATTFLQEHSLAVNKFLGKKYK